MLLDGRIALVTGASRGIGAATARLLAKNGAGVAVNYVNSADSAKAVLKDIEKAGGRGMIVQADVTVQEEAKRMVKEVATKLGDIDTLVLNAGLKFRIAPFTDMSWDDFNHKYSGEMKASFFTVKAVIPKMIEKKKGCIIAISSGLSRHPGQGFCSHSASKSAIDALVKSLALELGPHGIRVNTVAPGLVETDATSFLPDEAKMASASRAALGRVGQPDDIAGAVLLMAADHAGWLTGNYISADGGTAMI